MSAMRDLSGMVFGLLIVQDSFERRRSSSGRLRIYWNCVCECGNAVPVEASQLTTGHTLSCGCYHKKRAKDANTTHGAACIGKVTSEYRIWQHMLKRCRNENMGNYRYYGGRGIKVCERWQTFENFLEDMGPRPSSDYSLERIDNDKDYEPDNCKWATRIEQANNKRDSKFLTYQGVTQTVSQWARQLGVGPSTLFARLRLGWDEEKVINTPVYEDRGPGNGRWKADVKAGLKV